MNYREHMKKGECLFSALLWTVGLGLSLALLFYARLDLNQQSRWLFALLILLQLTGFMFHWHRYLTYDKERIKDHEAAHALGMAVAWTITAVCSWIVLLISYWNSLQIVTAIFLTIAAIIWWINYTKKKRAKHSQE